MRRAMANLRKLFQPTSPRSAVDVHGISSQQYASQYDSEPRTPASVSPYDVPSSKDVNRHYDDIERQFEQLHETFYSRTLVSLRQFRYNGSSNQAKQKNRHVDVVEAVFSKHRYQMATRSLSPITPYNEDVADRNIIAQYFPQVNQRYSQLITGSYSEDVADRNIARSKSNPIYKGPRSSRLNVRSDDRDKRSSLRPNSHQEPQTLSKACEGTRAEKTSLTENKRMSLRPQASAPDLTITEIKTPDLASFPRPPTSSGAIGGSGEVREVPTIVTDSPPVSREKPKVDVNKRDSSRSSDARSTSTNSRASGKKNVRDLSINTDITSMKKPSIRIEHCAIQPPTPNNQLSVSKNASIDEIVHTPLLTVTPTPLTPQSSPALDLDEIMKILKQAYLANHKSSPQYPTFETLQEIIIREINSHDAFRTIPFLTSELPWTPPSSDNSIDDILLPPPGPSRVKPLPLGRESPLSRLIRRRSNIEAGDKSPPLSNSPNNSPEYYDNQGTEHNRYSLPTKSALQQQAQPVVIPRRRRHTYGEPPTPAPGSFPTIQQPQRPTITHTNTHTSTPSVSSSSNFSLFPTTKSPPQPRYKSHFKRKSDPVPPSPHFQEFISNDAATPPIFPSYVRR